MSLNILLLLCCVILTGFAIAQQSINARLQTSVARMAKQHRDSIDVLEGYIVDLRTIFKDQLEEIETRYEKVD